MSTMNKEEVKEFLFKKFGERMCGQTVMGGENGETLYFTHDVEHFCELLEGEEEGEWDWD